MKIPDRPKISDAEVDKIANFYFTDNLPPVLLIGVRGYFLNTVGAAFANDFNAWDDAMLVYENGTLLKTFNANTDPSKLKQEIAMLDTGVYQFAKGTHKNRILAFRAYPEGVKLPCKRQDFSGNWHKSLCSYINIHDGGLENTWSEGCQTIINQGNQKQFNEFRDLVYTLMARHDLRTVTYLLIEESEMRRILDAQN